jgi:branched-chain amino acid transport system substrate-binding protein
MFNSGKLVKAGIVAGFSLLAVAGGCLSDGSVGPNLLTDGTTVKIGAIAPLSGSASAYGEIVRNVTNLAVDKVNLSGGINGKKLEIVFEDGQCDGKYGTAAAEKLVNVDKVNVIMGGTCSGETLGAATVTEPAKVILISPGASSPKISEAGEYVFRTYPSDNGKGAVLAQYAINQKWKKVGTIAEQSDYTLGLKDVFDKGLKDGGVESYVETYTKESSDFRTPLLKLKNDGAEALFIDPQTPDKGLLILNQLKEMNWSPKLLTQEVLGTDTATLAKVKAQAEGMITADVVPPEDGGITQLRADYKTKYNKDLNYESIGSGAYDAVMVLKDAISASKGDVDKLKAYLYSLKDYKGVNGTFGFDVNGDPTLKHALLIIKDGKAVPVKSE